MHEPLGHAVMMHVRVCHLAMATAEDDTSALLSWSTRPSLEAATADARSGMSGAVPGLCCARRAVAEAAAAAEDGVAGWDAGVSLARAALSGPPLVETTPTAALGYLGALGGKATRRTLRAAMPNARSSASSAAAGVAFAHGRGNMALQLSNARGVLALSGLDTSPPKVGLLRVVSSSSQPDGDGATGVVGPTRMTAACSC
jgi:hypothetical protein